MILSLTHIFIGNDTFVLMHDITVKQLQTLLKTALNRTSKTDFDPDCIMKVRKQISNVKLGNIL
jgi:hypothetical protein